MARIPREIVDTVRERTDIVEVVSRHVRLQRKGQSYVGLCPFHQEKTPSFNVVPNKGIFHCFGCQEGGDVFKFVMQMDGLSFVEAVKELAQAVGVDVPERELSHHERQAIRRRATLYDVLEAAASFYTKVLLTRPEGESARRYLDQRGMSRETIESARLGYAPPGWSNLLDQLTSDGFAAQRLTEAGLVREGKRDGHYDTFRDRVVFPICDQRSRVVGFGGRLMEGDGPKYINSPETRLYEKSKVLYGIEKARGAIQRADRAIIVEGYFDVLSMHQHGFEEAIATCGTSLTPEHLERIRRLTRNVLMLTDADEAGSRAAERSLPLFLKTGLQPWRVQLPGAKDPDELLQDKGPEALEAALSARQPLVEWVIGRKLSGVGGVMGREALLDELMPILEHLPAHGISEVAARLKVNERLLLDKVRAARQSGPPPPQDTGPPEPAPGWRPHRDMVHLFWLLVHRYDQVADLFTRVDPDLFQLHAPVQPALARLVSGEPIASVIEEERDAGVRRTLLAVVSREKLYDSEDAAFGACQMLARLGRDAREAILQQAVREIETLLAAGDMDAYRTALERRSALRSDQQELDQAIKNRDVERIIHILAPSSLPSDESGDSP